MTHTPKLRYVDDDRAIIERGQARGDIRGDLDPEAALELMAGPFLARVLRPFQKITSIWDRRPQSARS
jgi:Tetracyclin repressor-like, C-terminal domain